MFTPALFIIQLLNGLQYGITLFLFTAGLTLVLGVMNFMNLAHASLYMIGAYYSVALGNWSGSFVVGLALALPATFATTVAIDWLVFRKMYARHHLDQVLVTFGLTMFLNEAVRMIWGSAGLYVTIPGSLAGNVNLPGGAIYPVYRVVIILVGCLVALGLYFVMKYTKVGMLIRAGADKPEMVEAVGIDIGRLFRGVVACGAALAALAGALTGPLFSVEPGMGDSILILALVTIVIGGIGSIRGSFIAALIVGVVDAMGRMFLPQLFSAFLTRPMADAIGPATGSMLIYLLMIAVLLARPDGLFPVKGR
ncbi:MAG: branched-chain amino acid ABC transporter permease [Burkholderiaceae bacterium]|nr:branched-chain amino acid ABC transporter permease [Burkholderiaceae bacterium]